MFDSVALNQRLGCICHPFVTWGRLFVIDLGLSGLLDRFEKTFGTVITNFLLGLIGLTVAVVCVGLIATYLIPAFLFLVDDQLGAKYTYFSGAIGYLLLVVFGVAGSAGSISSMIERRQQTREARLVLDDTLKLHQDLKTQSEKLSHLLSKAANSFQALQNDNRFTPAEKVLLARWQSEASEINPNSNDDNQ